MKRFEDYNPISIFLFFAGATVPAMFCMDMFLLIISIVGALLLFFSLNSPSEFKSILWYFLLPIIGGIVNPIFNHNGMTVLFLINDTPFSLEAVLYGVTVGLMLFSVLLWFRSFSQIMTSDKLLYIFGSISPKLALIFSMTLRFIPLYKKQIKKVNEAGKVLGLYKDDTAIDKIRGGMRVFSVMVTWGLENGVITADSMSARGYGVGKRSRYAIFKWRKTDFILLALAIILTGLTIFGIYKGAIGFTFYPGFSLPSMGATTFISYIGYGLLILMPTILNLKEALLWKYLMSEI